MKLSPVILAAGKGTRMRSETLPKVMHPLAGKPMIAWVLDAVRSFGTPHLVVGHLREQVETFVRTYCPEARFSYQKHQDGTGGAVRCAFAEADTMVDRFLILPGDAPLLKKDTIGRLIVIYERERADLALVTCILDDPAHYGRVKRSPDGAVMAIVEYNDATEEERAIQEVNSGIYLASREFLAESLPRLTNDNAKKEYYLTDIVRDAVVHERRVVACLEDDFVSLTGINSPEELAAAERLMQARLAAGVVP